MPPAPAIGAHVATSGGLVTAVTAASRLGVEVIQIFASSPRTWKRRVLKDDEIKTFRSACTRNGIRAVYIHASYLINLASEESNLVNNSIRALTDDLKTALRIGAAGVIVHPGAGSSGERNSRISACILRVLSAVPEVALIIENSSGQGHSAGSTVEELADILHKTGSPRVNICIDTVHAHARGYDLVTTEGIQGFAGSVNRLIGLNRLACFHINDSKTPRGSRTDRHADIGDGTIGLGGLGRFVTYNWPHSVPFILETPGANRQGPDRINVSRLKKLILK